MTHSRAACSQKTMIRLSQGNLEPQSPEADQSRDQELPRPLLGAAEEVQPGEHREAEPPEDVDDRGVALDQAQQPDQGHRGEADRQSEQGGFEKVAHDLSLPVIGLRAISEVARDKLDLEGEVRLDMRLVEDLQLDSIRLLTLAMEVEDRFKICLDEEDEEAIVKVADLVEVVRRELAA